MIKLKVINVAHFSHFRSSTQVQVAMKKKVSSINDLKRENVYYKKKMVTKNKRIKANFVSFFLSLLSMHIITLVKLIVGLFELNFSSSSSCSLFSVERKNYFLQFICIICTALQRPGRAKKAIQLG